MALLLGCKMAPRRQHKSLLPLKIRNKTMWFANNSRFVSLALLQGQEVKMLEWFMDELYQDIEHLVVHGWSWFPGKLA